MDGLREKLLAVLIVFALLPMACIGLLSFIEMNRASLDVQNNITSLSTTLNRSALAVGPDEADQVQLAIAKARQYEQFFMRIASENELIAAYAAASSANESCVTPPGIWIAPIGANQTLSDLRDDTVKSLCAPAMAMQELHKADSSLFLSYIGTEDGVLAVWPYSNKTLSNAALFGYKDMSYYSQAKQMMKTIWTGPYVDSRGEDVITVATPFFRNSEFGGIAGMDVSLGPIFDDLSSLKGRGYPFIIDPSGTIIYRPKTKPENRLRDLFASENLIKSADVEVRAIGKSLLKGSSGSIVVGLGSGDAYVAYARIAPLGWTLCIAYVAEEMSLPARYIDAGIRDVAMSTTAGLGEASRRIRDYALIVFVITVLSVLGGSYWLFNRIDGQIALFVRAADRISRGEFDVEVAANDELAPLGTAFNKMADGLKVYAEKMRADEAVQQMEEHEMSFLEDVKRYLVPEVLPSLDDYEVRALYWPSKVSRFDLYDIEEAGGRIVLTLASVGGDGLQAAMLAVMSRTLIRASPDRQDPTRAIGGLNSQINRHGHGTNLVAFYAVLDPIRHTIEYVNAGFNPPFIVDPGGMVDTLGGGGLALGMLDNISLEKTLIPIQQGDVLVMYSDGVVEEKDEYGNPFGVERLINLVIANRERSAAEILLSAEKELLDHANAFELAYDVTLIILKRE
jgi:sigma-B regulation protein RsbU (phosphoserine phosphatase)